MSLFSTIADKVHAGRSRHRHFLRGTSSLLVATAVQAIGGFLFWVIAARLTNPDDVGRFATLYSSTLFVMFITNLGLVVTIARVARTDSIEDRMRFAIASGITALSSVVGSIVFIVIFRDRAQDAGPTTIVGVAFVICTTLYSLAQVVDTRATSLRQLNVLLARSTGAAIAKCALLLFFLPSDNRALWLFVFAVGPDGLSSLAETLWFSRGVIGAFRRGIRPTAMRAAARYAKFAYISQLAVNAPIQTLPVIVFTSVDAATNASFFVAWGFVGVVFLLPQAATMALHIEGDREGQDISSQMRLAIAATVGVTVVCFLGSLAFAHLVPAIFGTGFGLAGDILPWLVAGCIPWGIVVMMLAEARVQGRYWTSVTIATAATVCLLVPEFVLTRAYGVTGTAIAWICGTSAAAVAASLIRRMGPRLDRVKPPWVEVEAEEPAAVT